MLFEVEFAQGLASIVEDEIRDCVDSTLSLNHYRNDAIILNLDATEKDKLLSLRTAIAVYAIVQFDIPRPKALLGHEHFHRLVSQIEANLDLTQYESLYLSAAGSDSSVMTRIKEEISQHLRLSIGDDEGDLLLRIRRTANKQGWEVLFRLTPRPLATRDWRICNYQGALNASIAAAMIHLTQPTIDDRFLNITSGSGTLLIERALFSDVKQIVGIDISQEALGCAVQNLQAANTQATLIQADGIQLPFVSETFNKLVADLPFGQLVGSHDENEWLYPAILTEAARIAERGTRFVVITHEIQLMETTIKQSTEWQLCEAPLKITQSGLHPRIYILERK